MNDIITTIENYRDFKVVETAEGLKVDAYGNLFPLSTPLSIELTCYRFNLRDNGLQHMIRAHHILWPEYEPTWNYWTERRFQAHIEGHPIITWAGGANCGKAQNLNAYICCPTGWKKLKYLKVGDAVLHPFKGEQIVEKLHPIQTTPFYRIIFDDGIEVECSSNHLWEVQTRKDRDRNRKRVLSVKEMIPLLDKQMSVPRAKAVQFNTQELPIPPYLLGLFIGDGSYSTIKTSPCIYLGETKEKCKNYLTNRDHYCAWDNDKHAWVVSIKELKLQLQELGFLGVKSKNRFIPKEYLIGDIEQRTQLLAGLLDSDGSIDPRSARYEYSTGSYNLHLAVIDLARSLGFRASVSKVRAKLNGKDYGEHYRISISDLLNGVVLPTRRLRVTIPQKRTHQKIVDIIPIGRKRGRCITVSEPDGLYMTNDFVVTHNSLDAAKLALLFWLANPQERTVLVASTSLSDLDSRIWGYVKRFYDLENKVELPGQLYSSPPPRILYQKADTVHGMFAVPLQRGTHGKTASTLIGRHPKDGFLAIIDEGTDVTPGFMDAIPNWEKAPLFQCIVIGNSCSMFDPHGLLSRPRFGWDTVNPDFDTEWPTAKGLCLYFDCYQSPAIHEPDPKKKQLLSKFLFTEESIKAAKIDYGEESPQFQRFTRGFWPSEDTANTILTPVMVDKFKIKSRAQWSGTNKLYRLAALDPAFTAGGDDCVLRFGVLGKAVGGRWVLDYGGEENIHTLVIDAQSEEPAEYQIVNQTMRLCEQMGVEPHDFAVDVHGMGSGLGAIFETVWSPHIYKVSSAGPPSRLFVDDSMTLTARDAYDRRVTELWFSMQKFVQSGQIKGLDELSCQQFCTRVYDWKGRKYHIETKEDYKMRLGKVDNRYVSPDQADAACMMLDLARQFYGFIPGAILDSNQTGDPTAMQMYFNQQYMDGLGPQTTPIDDIPVGHPNSWEDGFMTSQFDIQESDDY